MKNLLKVALMAVVTVTLFGCAHPDFIKLNDSYSYVIEELGQPDSVTKLPDGKTRIVYSMQPMGQACYVMIFDTNGKLVFKDNILQEKYYRELVKPGKQTSQDILVLFGKPCETWTYDNLGEHTFMYRYLDSVMYPMAFWVDFDNKTDKVLRYVISIDPWSQRDSDTDRD